MLIKANETFRSDEILVHYESKLLWAIQIDSIIVIASR